MEENENIIDVSKFRNIKYFEEELLDVYSFISDFMKNHSEKENKTCYESIISHKIDRLCYGIPNFILSVDVFKMVKDIFLKIIEIKEKEKENKKITKNEQNIFINEMYMRFKYLLEWCILYYEESYL